MSVALLPLCSTGKVAMRDGYVGQEAFVLLPYYGRWYPDGKVCSNSSAYIAQNKAINLKGTRKPDTFRKDASVCL